MTELAAEDDLLLELARSILIGHIVTQVSVELDHLPLGPFSIIAAFSTGYILLV